MGTRARVPRTGITGLDGASRRTTVARRVITVVTGLARIYVPIAAIMSRGRALTVVVALTVGRARARGALSGKMTGVAASVVIIAILAIFYLAVAALSRGCLGINDETFLTIFMVVATPLIAENFIEGMAGGVDRHVLEMHVVVLEIEKAVICSDRPFVDRDGGAVSIDNEAIRIHEGEGAL
jgi:hypothetical protein